MRRIELTLHLTVPEDAIQYIGEFAKVTGMVKEGDPVERGEDYATLCTLVAALPAVAQSMLEGGIPMRGSEGQIRVNADHGREICTVHSIFPTLSRQQ